MMSEVKFGKSRCPRLCRCIPNMKDFFDRIGYFLLALALLLLDGLLGALIAAPLMLWEKLCWTAQRLRYPAPPGGMYGNMARALKARCNNRKN